MRKKSTELVATLSPTWEALEAFARQSMQQFLQLRFEEEVDGLVERGRYEHVPPWMPSPATATALAGRSG